MCAFVRASKADLPDAISGTHPRMSDVRTLHPPLPPAAPASTQICCSSSAPSPAQYQLTPTPYVLVYWGALHFCFGILFWCSYLLQDNSFRAFANMGKSAEEQEKAKLVRSQPNQNRFYDAGCVAWPLPTKPFAVENLVKSSHALSLLDWANVTACFVGPSLSFSTAHRISLRSDSGRTGQCRHGRHS